MMIRRTAYPAPPQADWLERAVHGEPSQDGYGSLDSDTRGPHKLLIGRLLALDQEMDWFETVAANRSLDLNAARHPVCRRYVDFLIAAAYSNPFEVLLAILYGVEVSHLVAWSSHGPEVSYAKFIQRWSNDRLKAYVRDLLAVSDQHQHPDQQQYRNEVLRHEADFWRMTWEG